MVILVENNISHSQGHLIRQKDTTLYLDEISFGKGNLLINTKNIIWVNSDNKGITLSYLHLSAHGISRDKSRISEECLCLFYNKKIQNLCDMLNISDSIYIDTTTDNQNHINSTSFDFNEGLLHNDNDSDNEYENTNIYLAPLDKGTLDSLYQSIKEFQRLNPDPEEPLTNEDDYYNEDDDDDSEYWQPGSIRENEIEDNSSRLESYHSNNNAENNPNQIWQVPIFDVNGQLIYNNSHPQCEDDETWVPPSLTQSSQNINNSCGRNQDVPDGDEPMNLE
ncbi:unnamed protein product [Gordionus sp. m RMFG-2023]|uniref:methylosome subunit pICln-like isoform X1 n=1 Tax=Gordionus sp. m RMFG-2023 TaxID=3053472 RepID=UPI0030E09EA9